MLGKRQELVRMSNATEVKSQALLELSPSALPASYLSRPTLSKTSRTSYVPPSHTAWLTLPGTLVLAVMLPPAPKLA